jgi:hypothetical protein
VPAGGLFPLLESEGYLAPKAVWAAKSAKEKQDKS